MKARQVVEKNISTKDPPVCVYLLISDHVPSPGGWQRRTNVMVRFPKENSVYMKHQASAWNSQDSSVTMWGTDSRWKKETGSVMFRRQKSFSEYPPMEIPATSSTYTISFHHSDLARDLRAPDSVSQPGSEQSRSHWSPLIVLFPLHHASCPGPILREGFLEEAAPKGTLRVGEGFDFRWLEGEQCRLGDYSSKGWGWGYELSGSGRGCGEKRLETWRGLVARKGSCRPLGRGQLWEKQLREWSTSTVVKFSVVSVAYKLWDFNKFFSLFKPWLSY